MERVKHVSIFPVGETWTVIVEYEMSVERRNFASRGIAEWFANIMKGRMQQ